MTPDAIVEAAELLAALRLGASLREQIEELPESCRPGTLAEAYAIQEAVRPLLAARGLGPPSGWKIGCTTPVMQEYLSIPHPCAGTLFQATTHAERAELRAADFLQLGLECEIAVRLDADIGARAEGHDRESVAPAVGAVMASVEIVEHRFRDFTKVSTPSLVADDFFSCGCVLGASVAPDDAGDLAALRGGFRIDGAPAEQSGEGAAILGHPLTALAWLADHAAERGTPLRPGQVVTLGSVVKTIYPEAGTRIEARFEGLPPVAVAVV